MLIDFPDGTIRREQERCRESLETARRRYEGDKSPVNREEYLRVLKRFADIAIYEFEALMTATT